MRRIIRAVACLSLLLPALQAGAQTAESSLQQVIADFEHLSRTVDPIAAGQEGDRAALRRLPDVSRAAELAYRAEFAFLAERLAKVDAQQLSADAALNHALLTRLVEQTIQELDFDFSRIAFQSRGEQFNIRRFHDTVLLGGPLPLDVVEKRVLDWIEGDLHGG